MGLYTNALKHVNSKDFKKTHQKLIDENRDLFLTNQNEIKENNKIKKIFEQLKTDWRSDLFLEKEKIQQKIQEDNNIKNNNIKVSKKLKFNWREELEKKSCETKIGIKTLPKKSRGIVRIKNKKINPKINEQFEKNYPLSHWKEEFVKEAMTTKGFEYLYGLSIHDFQINSIMSAAQNTDAQDIVDASADVTSYQFGSEFPGSFINSIGDNQVTSYSKVDALALYATPYGNVVGANGQYLLTTGPEGFEANSGSVVPRVNLETTLGITLPDGFPNGLLDGTPIEGSAISKVFTKASPGKKINFEWSFASSEDELGDVTVDDYAFVAIKGKVTKIVSVLTKGLKYGGQFLYTVKPEDIGPNKTIQVSIGVVDVYDPYIQTALAIRNFGSLWTMGSIAKTTDAADLGMPVDAANPNKKKQYGDIEIAQNLPSVPPGPSGYKAPGTYDPNRFHDYAWPYDPSKGIPDRFIPSPNLPQTGPGLSQADQDIQIAQAKPIEPLRGQKTDVRYDSQMKMFVPLPSDRDSGNLIQDLIKRANKQIMGGTMVAHYEPEGQVIKEKRTFKSFQKVSNKISGYYEGKPSPNGFPDNPPPKMVNGWHPEYGKRERMYNRMDKMTAMSTPPTGNIEIDKKVNTAKKQPK